MVKGHAIFHLVQLWEVKEMEPSKPCPEPIQELLSQFTPLFEEPQGLPPRRVFDRKISLLPRAKPVNLRLYRYNPGQKDEIEKQIKEMLQ